MRRKGTLQDFPDDRLLAFIVFVRRFTCLPSRLSGLPLRLRVYQSIILVIQQPLFEYAMTDNLGAVGAPHMDVGVRLVEAKEAMLLQRLALVLTNF